LINTCSTHYLNLLRLININNTRVGCYIKEGILLTWGTEMSSDWLIQIHCWDNQSEATRVSMGKRYDVFNQSERSKVAQFLSSK
jgi:hypothetical protein